MELHETDLIGPFSPLFKTIKPLRVDIPWLLPNCRVILYGPQFTISVAPRGTWKPPIEQSSNDSRGSSNGPAGYMRNVLFMMQWR
jgi:hypothetical protein